jgi:hypothetical protein
MLWSILKGFIGFTRNFETVAQVKADKYLRVGQKISIDERDEAVFNVVLASTVTPNTFDVIQCTGVPTLALVLKVQGKINVRHFGAVGDGVTDDRAAIQAALDYVGKGKIFFPNNGASYVIGSTHPTEIDYGLIIQSHKVVFEGEASGDNNYVLLCKLAMKAVISATSRKDGIQFRNFGIDCDYLADHGVYLSEDYYPYQLWDSVTITRALVNNAEISTWTSAFNHCKFSRSVDGVKIQGLNTGVVTSVTMNSCYSLSNSGKGFDFKNLIYSTLISCASDTIKIA